MPRSTSNIAKIALFIALVAGLSACSRQLRPLQAEQFAVYPTPLQERGGRVHLSLSGHFAGRYMHPKAVLTLRPQMLLPDGQLLPAEPEAVVLQGEKAGQGHQVVNYRNGGDFVVPITFAFDSAMADGQLVIRPTSDLGKARELPSIVVARGVNATAQWVYRTAQLAQTATAHDAYTPEIRRWAAQHTKYLLEQMRIRTSVFQSASTDDFLRTWREIRSDQLLFATQGISLSSYQADSTFRSALRTTLDSLETLRTVAPTSAHATRPTHLSQSLQPSDWEALRSLIAQSHLADKTPLLQWLDSLSTQWPTRMDGLAIPTPWQPLVHTILPELQQAGATRHYNIVGRTDDQLLHTALTAPSRLDLEPLLYAASLTDSVALRKAIYGHAIRRFPSDHRAVNALGQLAFAQGRWNEAKSAFERAQALPEARANAALIDIMQGRLAEAQIQLTQAWRAENYNEVMAHLLLAEGKWDEAAQRLEGVNTPTALLAAILVRDEGQMRRLVDRLPNHCPTTLYLKAVAAMRLGQKDAARRWLDAAQQIDPALAQKAAIDIEFSALRKP